MLLSVVVLSGCVEINTSNNDILSLYEDENVVVNIADMGFVFIEPGTFLMGIPEGYSGADGGENPRHQVTITKGFYIQITEVTQEQWYKIMGKTPSYFRNCGKDCPVEQVSWDDAQEFIFILSTLDDKYNYRLPTEAEWEYAAKAGNNGPYSFGECLTSFHANIHQQYGETETSTKCPSGHSYSRTIPVASLEKNAWGLYDMYGNVAEWCQDYFGERPRLHIHVIDPSGPEKGYARVVRGGSYASSPSMSQSGYSNGALQENRNFYTGLRLVMELKGK